MNNRTACASAFLFLASLGLGSEGRIQPAGQGGLDLAKIERILKTASIVSIDKNGTGGRNAPWIVVLNDGGATRRAIFKYIDRPKPAGLRSSYMHELAAYEIDKLLGFNRVPPVVERRIEGRKGSLQIMIEECTTEMERRRKNLDPPDKKAFEDALEDIGVFEALTACERNDLGDILIQVKDWHVYRVDFAEAFSVSSEFLPGQKIRRCSKKLYQALAGLDEAAFQKATAFSLGEDEIKTLVVRKTVVLDEIRRLIKEKGEAAVLF